MTEIASLAIRVETATATTGATRLERLASAASTAENAILSLTAALRRLNPSLAGVGNTAPQATKALQELTSATKSSGTAATSAVAATDKFGARIDKVGSAAERSSKSLQAYLAHVQKAATSSPSGGAPSGGSSGAHGEGGGLRGFAMLGSSGISTGILGGVSPLVAGIGLAAITATGAVVGLGSALADLAGWSVGVSRELDRVRATLLAVNEGDFSKMARDIAYVREQADRMGAPVDAMARGFAQISAAAKGTSIEGEGVRRVFEALSTASVGLHKTEAETFTMFKAITDMLSKGKVSAEELRRQLGNNLPGAFRLAADSMGITTSKLDKLMKTGQLTTEEFLLKFSDAVQKRYAPALEFASQSLDANINRTKSNLMFLGATIAEGFGLKDGAVQLFKGLADGLRELEQAVARFAASPAGKDLRDAMELLGFALGEVARGVAQMLAQFVGAPATADYVQVLSHAITGLSLALMELYATARKGENFLQLVRAGVVGLASGPGGNAGEIAQLLAENAKIDKDLSDAKARLGQLLVQQQGRRISEAAPGGSLRDTEAAVRAAKELSDAELRRLKQRQDLVASLREELELQLQTTEAGKQQLTDLLKLQKVGILTRDGSGDFAVAKGQRKLAEEALAYLDAIQRVKEEQANAQAQKRADLELSKEISAHNKAIIDEMYKLAGSVDVATNQLSKYNQMLAVLERQERMGLVTSQNAAKIRKNLFETLTPEGKSARGLQEEAQRMNENFRTGNIEAEIAKLDKLLKAGLDPDVYRRKWIEIRKHGEDAFGVLIRQGENFTQTLGNAFGNLVSGMKVNWRSLITDMLQQAARAYASQAFQKLFNLGISYLAGGTGAGTPAASQVGGGTGDVAAMFEATGTSGASAIPGIAPTGMMVAGEGATTGPITIQVNVNQKGEATSTASGTGQGLDLAKQLEGGVIQVLQRQMQPGGILYRNR